VFCQFPGDITLLILRIVQYHKHGFTGIYFGYLPENFTNFVTVNFTASGEW
jgi:hypothetical protein